MRPGPAYTLKRPSRRNPTRVCPDSTGEFDGEARRSRDRGDESDARGEGLLDDLEGHATTHHEHRWSRRHVSIEETTADDLVHGVVPAHVFPQHEQFTRHCKQGGGVQAAGLGEGRLPRGQLLWQPEQRRRSDTEGGFQWREMLVDGLDGRLATQAAGRRGEDVTRELVEVHVH